MERTTRTVSGVNGKTYNFHETPNLRGERATDMQGHAATSGYVYAKGKRVPGWQSRGLFHPRPWAKYGYLTGVC